MHREERFLVVLAVRKDIFLLRTAFYIEYDHILRRELKEYEEYIKSKDRTWQSRNSFNIMVAKLVQKYNFLKTKKFFIKKCLDAELSLQIAGNEYELLMHLLWFKSVHSSRKCWVMDTFHRPYKSPKIFGDYDFSILWK